MIYTSVEQLVGNTPLLRLTRLEKALGLEAKLLAKTERFNPAGSSKDRVALYMLDKAGREGKLKAGSVVIEPTSGNTGIGLACFAAVRGYRAIIVMPSSMSEERKKLMTAYGAELVLTDGALGMQGAIAKAEELAESIDGALVMGQFENPANPLAHYETTGPELWRDTDGKLDIFVAGIGTGGTISGVGKYLKEQNQGVEIVGVEPFGSPFITKGVAGSHGLQGIGAGFIPQTLDLSVIDRVHTVTDEDAYDCGRKLAELEGLLVGISSGAALCAAIKEAKTAENRGKTIAVLLPDTGDRYLSTPMFN